MNFISFSVKNQRGNVMDYCLNEREAYIIIEKVYNMHCQVTIHANNNS